MKKILSVFLVLVFMVVPCVSANALHDVGNQWQTFDPYSGVPDNSRWLVSPGSGIVVDTNKFKAGGGEFRGGGAGKSPSYYKIPGDSVVENPYYTAPTLKDYPVNPAPVVNYEGQLTMGLPVKALSYGNYMQFKEDSPTVYHPEKAYVIDDGYYYTDDYQSLNPIHFADADGDVTLGYQRVTWAGTAPVTGTYTITYSSSQFRALATAEIITLDKHYETGFGTFATLYRLNPLTGGYSDKTTIKSGTSVTLSRGDSIVIMGSTDIDRGYGIGEISEFRFYAYPIVFAVDPTSDTGRPTYEVNIPVFDVEFDPVVEFNPTFSPVYNIKVDVDGGDTAYYYENTYNNNTYNAYYYNQTTEVTNVYNTTIYYVDNSGQVLGSIYYDQSTDNYIIFNYNEENTYIENPDAEPTPSPSPSPSPDPGTPTPDPSDPSATPAPPPGGSSGGNDDNTDGGFFDTIGKLLGGIINGILGVLLKLVGAVVGFVTWLVQKISSFFPWIPPAGVTALIAGVVVCVVLRILKFILGR